MQQHYTTGLSRNTQYINLAIQSINSHESESEWATCREYLVPQLTVRDWIHGRLSRAETTLPNKKPTELEEDAIVVQILDLDLRGFPPTKPITRYGR